MTDVDAAHDQHGGEQVARLNVGQGDGDEDRTDQGKGEVVHDGLQLNAIDLHPLLGFFTGFALTNEAALKPHQPHDQGRGAMVVGFLALDHGVVGVQDESHGSLHMDAEGGECFGQGVDRHGRGLTRKCSSLKDHEFRGQHDLGGG